MLALLEGKTDLPISGVFGAGKTRSAAILVVGLLVFEPNLNLMILTKENVAAQAFAEHIEGLNMPPCVTSKIGRLVGYMELKKNRTKEIADRLWGCVPTRVFSILLTGRPVDH